MLPAGVTTMLNTLSPGVRGSPLLALPEATAAPLTLMVDWLSAATGVKAMLLSVTEGHDKPGKYPLMFREARAMVLNKMDLLPYTDFDVAAAEADARALNPDIRVLHLSARTGQGFQAWLDWLGERMRAARAGAAGAR